MKGIYLAQDLSHAPGIEKKIFKQIETFEKKGFTITKQINPKRNMLHLLWNVIPFFSLQYFNTKGIDWIQYDFVYFRKAAVFDKSTINLLKHIKKRKPSMLIILEIPTYPYLEEFRGLLKLDISLKEAVWTPELKNYVDMVVTYSDDQEIFGIPCLNISNAYEFTEKPCQSNSNSIHMLGVAALCFYHGYDRMIEGLKIYQQQKHKQKVIFTLVGDGPVLKDYQKMVVDYGLEDVVNLVGRKAFTELTPYYQAADIGVDSLARHRSGVSYNSSLKGKEYLAKGLPIISGVKTDLDDKNLSFYYRVSSDNKPVDIFEVVEWYQLLLQGKSKQALAEEIYEYGCQNFTFEKTFEPVIHFLKERINE